MHRLEAFRELVKIIAMTTTSVVPMRPADIYLSSFMLTDEDLSVAFQQAQDKGAMWLARAAEAFVLFERGGVTPTWLPEDYRQRIPTFDPTLKIDVVDLSGDAPALNKMIRDFFS